MKYLFSPAKLNRLVQAGVLALLLAAISPPLLHAEKAGDPTEQSKTLDRSFKGAAVLMSKLLENYHFAKKPIDGEVSSEWLRTYMESLDFAKLYFVEADYKEFFDKYGQSMAKNLYDGEMPLAFAIYQRFLERVDARVSWIEKRLAQPFDFKQNDTFRFDRSESKWPEEAKASDALWETKLKYDLLQDRLSDKPSKDANAEILQRYKRVQKMVHETETEEIVEGYLSALARVYDPHSVYMSPSTLEDFDIAMRLSLVGIGAVLTIDDNGYCTIKEIIKGGPADLDNRLKVNDKITGVAQGEGEFDDVVQMKLRNTVKLIRGKKGTVVRLKVIPAESVDGSTNKEITLVRDEIKITAQQASARLIEMPDAQGKILKLGVVELPSFYGDVDDLANTGGESRSTTKDVAALITRLKESNMDGLVLDLRNNGGGLLTEAVELVGLFIDNGPVVQVQDNRGQKQVYDDATKGALYGGPLIVLTNKFSASASEIVAGALQNYGRALIIGDSSTHGKGSVQTVQPLSRLMSPLGGGNSNAGAIKLTTAMYFLPSGDSTQNRGVIPDLMLPSPNDFIERSESSLPHSLPWVETSPARFTRTNGISPQLIGDLKKRSNDRLGSSEFCSVLNQQISVLKERMESKTVSLNLDTRKKEKKDDEARKKELEAARKKLASNKLAELYITLQNLKGTAEAPDVSSYKPKEDADEEEAPADISASADFHLRETLNILSDYIQMMRKPGQDPALASTSTAPSS